ncbi:YitT family protein [Listeria costaricensis]|uniref:YitT family protein n=1 Tax=Listeria costaricensis TaxID=2026604 RepID=UPI000C07B410|nr:YitT family protein [Listeria costaricensis]
MERIPFLSKLCKRERLMQVLVALTYAILAGVSMNFFLAPTHVYASGVNGLAQMLSSLMETFTPFHLSTSVWLLILNLPLIYLAWKRLGKAFTCFTLIAVVAASIMMKVLPVVAITENPLLAAIFGGCFSGLGVGICLKYGFSTGGTDIIALLIQKTTGTNVGQLGLILNGVIVVLAGAVYGWEMALYTMIAIYVNMHMLDTVHTKQQKVTVMIVTKNTAIVEKALLDNFRHGITVMENGYGAYTHEPVSMMLTVVSAFELYELGKVVRKADPNAFVNIQRTNKILGKFAGV